MNIFYAFITFALLFIPFILYVIVKHTHSHKPGIIVTFITTLIGCGLIHIFFDGLETPLLAAVALILILSIISYSTDNPLYFKLEPAIKSFVTSGFLLAFLVFGHSLSIQILQSLDASEVIRIFETHPQRKELLTDPHFIYLINVFERYIIFWGVIYGGWMVYIALCHSNVIWLINKGAYMAYLLIPSFISTYIHINYLAR